MWLSSLCAGPSVASNSDGERGLELQMRLLNAIHPSRLIPFVFLRSFSLYLRFRLSSSSAFAPGERDCGLAFLVFFSFFYIAIASNIPRLRLPSADTTATNYLPITTLSLVLIIAPPRSDEPTPPFPPQRLIRSFTPCVLIYFL